MARLPIPTVNKVVTLAVTLMVLLFVLKVAPIPENIKDMFRI